jgi:hypothetical protein
VEADRAARLETIQALQTRLGEVEADRNLQAASIQRLGDLLSDASRNTKELRNYLDTLEEELRSALAQAERWQAAAGDASNRLGDLHKSTSWQITAPLRQVGHLMKRIGASKAWPRG